MKTISRRTKIPVRGLKLSRRFVSESNLSLSAYQNPRKGTETVQFIDVKLSNYKVGVPKSP